MTKQNAPIKSTSGAGFTFEDKVVAYFLCHLLSGVVPFGAELGRLVRLDCQVRSQGWELDDLLLGFNSSGQPARCALSIRSNRQFTAVSAPADLVAAAWSQYLHLRSPVFDSNRDYVGIVTARHSPDIRESLNTLVKLARGQEPGALQAHVLASGSVSAETARLHDSFKCPTELAKPGVSEAPGSLLRRFYFREFDFDEAVSEQEATALSLCEQALVKGTLEGARSLWESLLVLANSTRTKGGYLDLPSLLASLRNRFALKAHPDFEADWRNMGECTRRFLDMVEDKLGGTLHVSRPAELQQISQQFQAHSAILVRGDSGSGKSALLKSWLQQLPAKEMQVLWVRAEDLQRHPDKPLAETWGLRWSLARFLSSSPARLAFLVIDGVEKCYSREAYQNIKDLVGACSADGGSSQWKIAFTCQNEEWPRVRENILRYVKPEFAALPEISVENFSDAQFHDVVGIFEGLRSLWWRPELKRLILRPKILDLLITQIQLRSAEAETAKWVGEANLIDWWWVDVIERKQATSARGRVLRRMAERMSDKLENEISMDELRGDEEICSDLVREGVCRIAEDRIRFAHDLLGDWARQRQLLAQGSGLRAYLAKRLNSPPWQKALRLVGLHLLERRDDLTDWKRLLAEFNDEAYTSILARDILLEATIFASEPGALLEKLWPEMVAQNGELLRRFLNRFLHSATIPDPHTLEFFRKEQANLATEMSALFRMAFIPYWPPVLNWLRDHIAEVTNAAKVEVAKVAKLWLALGDDPYLGRDVAAELAVTNAEKIIPLEFNRSDRPDDEEAKPIYEAALAAARDLPDRVAKIALALSGRSLLEPAQIPENADAEVLGIVSALSRGVSYSEIADDPPRPWPDGPRRPVNRAFQQVFLQGGPAIPLIKHQPAVAAEVTLALIISWPKTRIIPSREGPGPLQENYGFQFLHPDDSFYTSGPFLLFLRHQPAQALAMILKLVNFATERCLDLYFDGNVSKASVRVPFESGERTWFGDWRVYHWFRYPLITVHIVGAALMALEKWLYESVAAGRSVEKEVATILDGTTSVAFAGVLLALGKKKPELLAGPVGVLMAVREFHVWEVHRGGQYHGINLPHFETDGPGVRRRLKLEWEQMPHRGTTIHELCCNMLTTQVHVRPLFERIRQIWTARASEFGTNSNNHRAWLRWAATLNIENYRKKEASGQGEWEFIMPEDLRDDEPGKQAEGDRELEILPDQCRELIERQQPIPESKLEQVWELLQKVAGYPLAAQESGSRQDQNIQVVDAVAGLIGVLVVFHRQWLKKHLAREQWCKEKILQILQNPEVPLSDPYASNIWHFHSFAAQIVPVFWADEPGSPIWRQHVVRLSLYGRTVGLLCQAANAQRGRLGNAYRDLQCFILYLSVARLRERRQQYMDRKKFDFPKWVSEWTARFVSGSMPLPPPSWSEISVPESIARRQQGRNERDIPRRDVDLDVDFLLGAFSWMGGAKDLTQEERAEWIHFEREVLNCLLRTFPRNIKPDDEYSGTPYGTDRYVFKRIANLILQLRDDETPKGFWKPILDLGTAGHYWVEEFLNSFFSVGLQQTPVMRPFASTWRNMLDYAFSSPKWSGGRWFRLGEIWEHLLGLDWVIRSLWAKEHEPLLLEMKPYFARWAKERLHAGHDLRAFFYFLEADVAGCLVCDALGWITPLLQTAGRGFWSRDNDRTAYASFLGVVWDKHWDAVKRHPPALEGFKTLAAKLATYQNPLAMEITNRVAGGT